MSIYSANVKNLFAAVTLLPLLTIGQAFGEQPPVKITNSRLHSINYGVDSLQHWVGKARQGDAKRAAGLIRDLDKLEVRFGRIPKSETDEYKYVSKRLADIRVAIQKKSGEQPTVTSNSQPKPTTQTQKSAARPHPGLIGISNMLGNLEKDVVRYKDNQKQRTRMRSDLTTLKNRFARIPTSKHPDYQNTQKQLARVEAALQPKSGPLKMDAKQVAAYVESIRVKYSERIRLPEARDIMAKGELTAEDVDSIVAKMKAFGENADEDLPKLRHVVEATGSGEYWLKWLESSSIEQLKRNMQSIKTKIDNRVSSGLRDAKQRSSLDAVKNKYAFTNEAMRKQHEADHARTLRTIQQASRLEKQLGLPATWSSKQDELQKYIAAYEAKANSASVVRKLPAEVGTKQQHAIAKEVFKNKKYGVGKIVHLIVNSKLIPRDRIEHKPFNGKVETIVRKWEQFQVTTVEIENGQRSVYVNDLAKFTRAPNPTPIGKWILKKRFKSGALSNAVQPRN